MLIYNPPLNSNRWLWLERYGFIRSSKYSLVSGSTK